MCCLNHRLAFWREKALLLGFLTEIDSYIEYAVNSVASLVTSLVGYRSHIEKQTHSGLVWNVMKIGLYKWQPNFPLFRIHLTSTWTLGWFIARGNLCLLNLSAKCPEFVLHRSFRFIADAAWMSTCWYLSHLSGKVTQETTFGLRLFKHLKNKVSGVQNSPGRASVWSPSSNPEFTNLFSVAVGH